MRNEPANIMLKSGIVLLNMGITTALSFPSQRFIIVFLLSVGGACVLTAVLFYLGDEFYKVLEWDYEERKRNRRSHAVLRRVKQNRPKKLVTSGRRRRF